MPTGTVFTLGRLHGPLGQRPVPVATWDAIIALDPYDTSARWARARQKHAGADPPYDEMLAQYGPALQWDLRSMNAIAGLAKQRPEERRLWLTRTCEADVDECWALARLLVELKEEEEAATVYRRWRQQARNRVMVANEIDWLVQYEHRRGRTDKAFEFAQDAADTYSARGLRTLASLQEATGRLADAEATFRSEAERYEDPGSLYAFYERQIAAGRGEYVPSRDALVTATFPQGLERLEHPPSEPPREGVLLTSLSNAAVKAGLAERDVVVAVQGLLVRTEAQWELSRRMDDSTTIHLLLFRAGAYRELDIELTEDVRRLSVRPFNAR